MHTKKSPQPRAFLGTSLYGGVRLGGENLGGVKPEAVGARNQPRVLVGHIQRQDGGADILSVHQLHTEGDGRRQHIARLLAFYFLHPLEINRHQELQLAGCRPELRRYEFIVALGQLERGLERPLEHLAAACDIMRVFKIKSDCGIAQPEVDPVHIIAEDMLIGNIDAARALGYLPVEQQVARVLIKCGDRQRDVARIVAEHPIAGFINLGRAVFLPEQTVL